MKALPCPSSRHSSIRRGGSALPRAPALVPGRYARARKEMRLIAAAACSASAGAAARVAREARRRARFRASASRHQHGTRAVSSCRQARSVFASECRAPLCEGLIPDQWSVFVYPRKPPPRTPARVACCLIMRATVAVAARPHPARARFLSKGRAPYARRACLSSRCGRVFVTHICC